MAKVGQDNVESIVQSVRELSNGRLQKTTIITSKAPYKESDVNIIRPRTMSGGRVKKSPSLDYYENYEDLKHVD